MTTMSKRYRSIKDTVVAGKAYTIDDALDIIKKIGRAHV